MAETTIDAVVDAYIAHHARFHPVDATFMGLPGHDHRLPPAGPEAREAEAASLAALQRMLPTAVVPETLGARLDARMVGAALAHAEAAAEAWPRWRQPSWYTGEATFGLISLLLPTAPSDAAEALVHRLEAIPAFLAAGEAALVGQPTPADWCARARTETEALDRLLAALPAHPAWRDGLDGAAWRVRAALARFRDAIASLPPRDPACGRDYLALLMRDVHGLPWSPEEAVALAREAFAELGERVARHPARDLTAMPPVAVADLPAAYRTWHERALAKGGAIVTPARDYGLDVRPLPDWATSLAGALYFLSYRCPPALAAGIGSVYWAAPVEQPLLTVKHTHALHHGSIGHHTQNARARVAASRMARIAGTDCASGIALLAAGTMVEGWSSHVTDLAGLIPGFDTPQDEFASLQARRRNVASVLADIGLHAQGWGLERMRAFYRDEAGFPAARVHGETTRNSILPATRLMYYLGTIQIEALRDDLGGPMHAVHDALLSHGHVPMAWAAEEVRRGWTRPA